jgi:alanine racemase
MSIRRHLKRFIRKVGLFIDQSAAYNPLLTVRVSSARILHNLSVFEQAYPKLAIAPVLKANAYGHGLVETATIIEHRRSNHHVPFFVVDSYFEALVLRREGIHTAILIIGFTPTETILHNRLRHISFSIGSLTQMKELETYCAKHHDHQVSIHLKLDTGMHRQGITHEEIAAALDSTLPLTGIFSHLAEADNSDTSFTDKQIALWNSLVERFEARQKTMSLPALITHLGATAGSFHSSTIRATVIRLGLGLYGMLPHARTTEKNDTTDSTSVSAIRNTLRPALEMTSLISATKRIHAGESVGYDRTFVAPHDMTIAIIPAGYAEGIDRRLSNSGTLEIETPDGVRYPCPIIGRVSMNITTIDASAVPHIDHIPVKSLTAIIISDNLKAPNSVQNISNIIPYEVLVHIPSTIRRTVV